MYICNNNFLCEDSERIQAGGFREDSVRIQDSGIQPVYRELLGFRIQDSVHFTGSFRGFSMRIQSTVQGALQDSV